MLAFSAAVDYPAEFHPRAIASADFNHDGKLDLATTVGNRVSVRLGNGTGGFGVAHEFAAGGNIPLNSISIADFNNDTWPDIVVGDAWNFFSILKGNGDGTFQTAATTYSGGLAAMGDFNNDNNLDVVVNWFDGDWWRHVQVYLGNGQGGFVAGPDAYYGGQGGIAAVDLNNDGKLDVATAEGLAFLGDGNGWLQFDWNQQPLLSGGGVIATGDFTGEGKADLVVADKSVAVLAGRGDGRFDAPIHHSANGTVHTAVATADFNADGRLDAVVTNGDAGTVGVMLGNGDGTLRFAGAFTTGTSPAAITVGDFNGDGRPDVAVANAGSHNISVLFNDGIWEAVPPPLPVLSVNDTSVIEGNTGTVNAIFTVSLSSVSAADVTVQYATASYPNGNADPRYDYIATSGTVIIPAGQTSRTFTVTVLGDRIPEATGTVAGEMFAVILSAATNASIGDGQGVGTILDDEPRISISDVTKAEGKKGQTTLFTFTVTLSTAYDQPVTMSYRTVNGTAKTSSSDYVAKSGTLTFAPGEKTKTITIEVKGDSKKESNETFYLDLFGNSGNSLFSKKRGLGTILNDD